MTTSKSPEHEEDPFAELARRDRAKNQQEAQPAQDGPDSEPDDGVIVRVYFPHAGEPTKEHAPTEPLPAAEPQPIEPIKVEEEISPLEPFILPPELPQLARVQPEDAARPGMNHKADPGVRPTGEFKMPRSQRQKRRVPPVLLFLLSTIATLLVLGSAAFIWAFLTGNLPSQIEDLLALNGNDETGPTLTPTLYITATSSAGIVIEPTAQPTETRVVPTLTPTSAVPTATPTDGIFFNAEGVVLRGVQMVEIPGGSFLMGSPEEGEEHEIALEPYYIDKYEITNEQWARCVESGLCSEPEELTDYLGNLYYGTEEYSDFPVINISWYDAEDYCLWRGARLPTEAEWEKAARWNPSDGQTTTYPWGDDWDPTRLNFCDKSCALGGETDLSDGWPQTSPVGSFPEGESPTGVMDMAGNVAEWVADWYSPTYYQVSPTSSPTGPATGSERVGRGGAWGISNPVWLTATFRSKFAPDLFGPGLGARCAISAGDVRP